MVFDKKFDKKFFTSGGYKNYKEILSWWVEPVARRIQSVLKNKPTAKVLDVGCGYGDLLAELQDKYNFSVQGIDLSPYAIKKACPSVRKKIKKGSVLKLPFKNNSFDVVVCFDVIYYLTLEETKKAIKDLIDISRDYIFFNSLYRHSPEASQKTNPDPLRITILSKKEYIALFRKNGAKLVGSFREDNGGQTFIFKK